MQQLRHDSDAILTGIGTVLADDCLLTDRTGLPRSRPLLRIVLDSQLRLPLDSKMAQSAANDLLLVTTSAAPPERRKALESHGVEGRSSFDGPGGRADLRRVVDWLAREKYLSLMIEAGSRVNWAALESDVVDKIFFYYAPKILGGTAIAAAWPAASADAGAPTPSGFTTQLHADRAGRIRRGGYLYVHRNH